MKNFFTLLFILALGFSTYGQGSTGGTDGKKNKTTTKKKTTTGGTEGKTDKKGKTEDKVDITANWKSYSGSDVSIKYPTDWTIDESGLMSTTFFLYSPIEGEYDNFRENLNLIIQDFADYGAEGTSLKDYVELSLAQIALMIPSAEISSNQTKTMNGNTYQEVIYAGSQNGYDLKWKQLYFLENDIAYVLTFTAVQGKFSTFEATADLIFKSFKF